jgi:uncharacterized protein YfaP (DUF2135 family)
MGDRQAVVFLSLSPRHPRLNFPELDINDAIRQHSSRLAGPLRSAVGGPRFGLLVVNGIAREVEVLLLG